MKQIYVAFLALFAATCMVACNSTHEQGVKSDMRSQWTTVAATTAKATDAAKTVLTDEGLLDVKASSTDVDGVAIAKKADGTTVKVAISKVTATSSKVEVTVGELGEPTLGAEIVKKIEMQFKK